MLARLIYIYALLCVCWPSPSHATPAEIAPSMEVGPGAEPPPPVEPGTPPPIGPGTPPESPAAADTNAVAPQPELSLGEYSRGDWALVAPKVALIDMGGFLRLRGDMARRLDFGTGVAWEVDADAPQVTVPRYLPLAGNAANYTQTDMRLRVEPRINISPAFQITATIDLLDNLILGSTPQSLVPGAAFLRTPVNVNSRGQTTLRRGVNGVVDSIAVKRLWGQISGFNDQIELVVGRMPDQFGLGMAYNDGACLDCDYGTVADRLVVHFRALGHVFSPMVDWISRGPSIRPFGPYDPRPIDAIGWDDAMAYGLRITHEDHPDDVQDAVMHHRRAINYGLSNIVRAQARDLPLGYYNAQQPYLPANDPNINAATLQAVGAGERRDALIWEGDVYGKYFYERLEVAAELATQVGSFKDELPGPTGTTTQQVTKIFTLGLAAEARYFLRYDRRGARLGLKLGGASGDSRRGMGALDQADSQRGATSGGYDDALRNFNFSPDYHIDLLLFRRMLGTVTDATYLRPELAYSFDEKFSARLAAIYSQAMMARSTPSASAGGRGHRPLGFEIDGELAYGAEPTPGRQNFIASLAGGMLFPLSGFGNPNQPASADGGSFAWTLQARLYLCF